MNKEEQELYKEVTKEARREARAKDKWYHKDNFIDGIILTLFLFAPFLPNAIFSQFAESVTSSNASANLSILELISGFLLSSPLWFSMTTYAAYQLRDDNKLPSRPKLLKILGGVFTFALIVTAVYYMPMSNIRQGLLTLLIIILPLGFLLYWIFKK
tara:strand:+ start:291 stop:761 length:471 start_codon:yes stop_codon:yes gene_type:complete